VAAAAIAYVVTRRLAAAGTSGAPTPTSSPAGEP